MKKETLISIMKEFKKEGKVKDVYNEGFTIEGYKDEYGDDYIIDYGTYVTNCSFHCSVYVRVQEYFYSKADLRAFIEKVIQHYHDGYCVYNLVDELRNKEYCKKYYNKYLMRGSMIADKKKSSENTSC